MKKNEKFPGEIIQLAEAIYPFLEEMCQGKGNAMPYSDLVDEKYADGHGFFVVKSGYFIVHAIRCTRREFRKACKAMLRVLNKPVISCSKGIFVAETQEEIDAFMADQASRASEMYANADAARKCSPARKAEEGCFAFAAE